MKKELCMYFFRIIALNIKAVKEIKYKDNITARNIEIFDARFTYFSFLISIFSKRNPIISAMFE
jgi:hypothetical protein